MKRLTRTGLLAVAVAAVYALPMAPASAQECLEGTKLPPCEICYELPLGDRKCVLVSLPPADG